nr:MULTISPECIES: RnfH family protein [Glaesserella]
MSENGKIVVEVVYAHPNKYFLKKLELDSPLSIQNVILQSGVLQKYTEIDLRENKVGIFSRPAKLTDLVENGDRIEIYRPLIADPKEIRRKRAEEQKK